MIFFNDIKPTGWLKNKMEWYMNGHIGELDKLGKVRISGEILLG